MPSPYAVEQQLAAQLQTITDAQERAMVAAWAAAWAEIATDLYNTLHDILAAGGRLTNATVVRSERLAAALAGVADRLDDLAAAAGVTITTSLDDVLDQAVDGTAALIAAQLKRDEDVNIPRPVPAALSAIIDRTAGQITAVTYPLADETYATIQRELVRGVAAGDSPRETARRMVDRSEDLWNFGRQRAETIARTEILDAYRAAAAVSQDAASDVLAGWVWLAHLGPRTCPACLARHGSVHELTVAGPEGHQRCRCSRAPLARGADGQPRLDWVPDAGQHFAGLTRTQQVQVMGAERLALLNAGLVSLADLATKRSTPGWRDSWVVTPVRDLRAIATQRAVA